MWNMYYDDHGNPYYVSSKTGESKWEAPDWVEEFDQTTGASYFVKLDPYTGNALHSTWTKPHQFAKLVRTDMDQVAEEDDDDDDDDYFGRYNVGEVEEDP